jgi:uncharacterized membrane protein
MIDPRAKILGHPIHPMLIVFPLGLLVTSFFFDVLALALHSGEFALVAFWMIAAGVAGGLVAAVFGLIDWLAIADDTREKRIGMWHGGLNVMMVGLFAAGWFLRRPLPSFPPLAAVVLSGIAVALALVGGWLGGELVYGRSSTIPPQQ